MGEFVAFLVRRLTVTVLLIVGATLTAFGYIQQGYDMWLWHLPPWAFQLAGFLLFVSVVIYLLFDWDKKMQSIQTPIPEDEANETPPLQALTRARSAAATATFYANNDAIIASSVAQMRAAILTANKKFGIPIMIITSDYAGVQRARLYLDAIIPYLQSGHKVEAAAAAQQIIDQ